jgi:hypothetical protein
MSIVAENDLLELAGRIQMARRIRGGARTRVARDIPIRLRSQFRTHDRLGSRAYAPGDSVRMLILRDLLNRGQLNVRTYLDLAEMFIQVTIDPSRSLLADPQAGPFAVKLAFSLALAGLRVQQPTRVTFLSQRPPTPTAAKMRHMGTLIEMLAGLEPIELAAVDHAALLEKDLGNPHANMTFYFLTHVGHSLGRLETMLRVIAARVRRSTVFLIVSEREFAAVDCASLPDGGGVVELDNEPEQLLPWYLDRAVALGRHVGTPVEPLLILDHGRDIETLLPVLAGLS